MNAPPRLFQAESLTCRASAVLTAITFGDSLAKHSKSIVRFTALVVALWMRSQQTQSHCFFWDIDI